MAEQGQQGIEQYRMYTEDSTGVLSPRNSCVSYSCASSPCYQYDIMNCVPGNAEYVLLDASDVDGDANEWRRSPQWPEVACRHNSRQVEEGESSQWAEVLRPRNSRPAPQILATSGNPQTTWAALASILASSPYPEF